MRWNRRWKVSKRPRLSNGTRVRVRRDICANRKLYAGLAGEVVGYLSDWHTQPYIVAFPELTAHVGAEVTGTFAREDLTVVK